MAAAVHFMDGGQRTDAERLRSRGSPAICVGRPLSTATTQRHNVAMSCMRKKIIYDTQVISWVQSGAIPLRDWEFVSRYISGHCRYCVSLVTLSELVVGLTRGDDAHFGQNKERIALLCLARKSTYFSLVGEFIRTQLLDEPPTRREYLPDQVKLWPQIIQNARNRTQLTGGRVLLPGKGRGATEYGFDLEMLAKQVQNGKAAHARALQDLREGNSHRPTQKQWVLGVMQRLNITATPQEVALLRARLDAAYHYDSSLFDLARDNSYDFSRHDSDWLDSQQIYYLADPTVLLVSLDSGLKQRTSGSTQASQILDFAELRALASRR
jgi:hypothetical protein